MIEPRYTIPEVSVLIREAPHTIYRAIHRGQFPGAYKNGQGGRTSTWLIPESAVEHFLALR